MKQKGFVKHAINEIARKGMLTAYELLETYRHSHKPSMQQASAILTTNPLFEKAGITVKKGADGKKWGVNLYDLSDSGEKAIWEL